MRIRGAQTRDAAAVAGLLTQLGYPHAEAEAAERLAALEATRTPRCSSPSSTARWWA